MANETRSQSPLSCELWYENTFAYHCIIIKASVWGKDFIDYEEIELDLWLNVVNCRFVNEYGTFPPKLISFLFNYVIDFDSFLICDVI